MDTVDCTAFNLNVEGACEIEHLKKVERFNTNDAFTQSARGPNSAQLLAPKP